MSFVKSCWLLLILTFLTITLNISPSFSTEYYWVSGDGYWDENVYVEQWKDSLENAPGTPDKTPGSGDSAFLVNYAHEYR